MTNEWIAEAERLISNFHLVVERNDASVFDPARARQKLINHLRQHPDTARLDWILGDESIAWRGSTLISPILQRTRADIDKAMKEGSDATE